MGGRDCERPGLSFVDLVLQISECMCLPMRPFPAERQSFGFGSNPDKRQNIRIIFEARLEATARNRSRTLDRGNDSRKYAFRRFNNHSASSNYL
jgi:hypothetical protein